MNYSKFNSENRPTKEEMEIIGSYLLNSLSTFLGLQLSTFREHYVQEGSIVLTFRSSDVGCSILRLKLEGTLLFDVRQPGLHPSVDAEILLFSFGGRLGLQRQGGKSYLLIRYEWDKDNWNIVDWVRDSEEDWEKISNSREDEYHEVIKTYDFE